ncbi:MULTISPECIES: glycosyltransferase [Burkholderia]|uniref:glycosyltransferase n=1 Tax=Burkholderia TaxID=32008 RepID=UPI00075DD0B0|nr:MULTISPECIES: glycosyltransferase [Burkholderia]AOJ67839.1 glycosyltransferase [Burkholderia savannae]KVG43707.1 glycosyltransferase [Burkholderia sp. MSMB0265]KVG88869.1 glycosyltransferase [Burkholderia sp. MSMB2040]KVG93042.1 glycosyltransferase [Burkholderia sp. MSMB2042]KVH02179.1 glycosyltransferase [Burkholderia sp. MSMB2041]
MKVFILHPGKANYPEIAAYRDFLGQRGFDVHDGDASAYARFGDRSNCILWCIMGFYRSLPPARFVIHDYRSLSVGRLAAVKDALKRALNAKPDLRIFQNERMRGAMAFRDEIPSLLLPMGVPDWIFGIANEPAGEGPAGRFCYIGEMSRERGFHRVLAAYRDAPRTARDTLVLVGEPEREIHETFGHIAGIQFVGRVPQRDALKIVQRSEYAVCYFPYHRPHCFQTPTKLLEYAALGKKIVCNDAPSNVDATRTLGIRSHVTGASIFDELLPLARLRVPRNEPAWMKWLGWTAMISQSGVTEHLDAIASMRSVR